MATFLRHCAQNLLDIQVTRPVQLLESCLADIPFVLGHLRPVILIPVGLFSGLPVGQIETILLHELAHIRRCDYLVNAMQRSIESFFFYHLTTASFQTCRLKRREVP
jgi:bla regulator protein blaR1